MKTLLNIALTVALLAVVLTTTFYSGQSDLFKFILVVLTLWLAYGWATTCTWGKSTIRFINSLLNSNK